jgi:hypothetical protein
MQQSLHNISYQTFVEFHPNGKWCKNPPPSEVDVVKIPLIENYLAVGCDSALVWSSATRSITRAALGELGFS